MKLALAVGFILLIIVATISLPIADYTTSILTWVDGLGLWGYGAFIGLYILFTIAGLPAFLLTLGAGVVFGIIGGFVAVSVGSTLGACAAFIVGRFLARDLVANKIAGNKKFAAIDKAVNKEGAKIVFLTRLSPVFPFNLLNYAYGLTGVKFSHYTLASWVGMMPGTLMYVYIGSLFGSIAEVASGSTPSGGIAQLLLQGLGLLATIAVSVYITKLAKKALKQDSSI